MVNANTGDGGLGLYREDTTDPGPYVLLATIIFSVLLLAVIPISLKITEQCASRKEGQTSSCDTSESGPSKEKTVTADEGGVEVGLSSLLKGMTDTHSIARSNNIGDDEESVSDHSYKSSGAGSVARSVLSALLDGTPRSGPTLNRTRSHVEKRDIMLDGVDGVDGDGGVWPHILKLQKEDEENEENEQRSVLGKLDHDEVSIRDAVDADDGVYTGISQRDASGAWNSSSKTVDNLLAIAEYDFEMRRLVKLATPFTLEALAVGLLEVLNVGLIGRLIGTRAVTAYVTVDLVVGFGGSILSGFSESLTTLCSQAIGAKNKKLAGQYLQLSILFFLVLYTPIAAFLLSYMPNILEWFGMDEETIKIGSDFTRIYVFVEAIDSVAEAIDSLLDTIDREFYSSGVGLLIEVVATCGILIVCLQEDPSLDKVGFVFLAIASVGMLLNVLFIMWRGWYDPYLSGMVGSCALLNWKAVTTMLNTSTTLSVGFVLAYGEWEVLTFLARYLGPDEVVAWAILGTLWDVLEDVTESVADACEVRVAMHLGAAQPSEARMSAYKSLYMGAFIGVMLSAVLFIIGDNVPMWITTDPTLQRMVAELIPLFGIGNIGLTIGTIAWTAVGAQGRYRLATAVGFGGSWLVTMPLAALCSVVLRIDLQGQTAAVVVGYMTSGAVNSYLLFTSDWQKLSREVIAANEDVSSSSSSSDDESSIESEVQQKVTSVASKEENDTFEVDDSTEEIRIHR